MFSPIWEDNFDHVLCRISSQRASASIKGLVGVFPAEGLRWTVRRLSKDYKGLGYRQAAAPDFAVGNARLGALHWYLCRVPVWTP